MRGHREVWNPNVVNIYHDAIAFVSGRREYVIVDNETNENKMYEKKKKFNIINAFLMIKVVSFRAYGSRFPDEIGVYLNPGYEIREGNIF